MKAGRELDVLVHKKIMTSASKKVPGTNFKAGPSYEVTFVKKVCHETGTINLGTRLEYPNYSTDIAAAWQVIEHLSGKGFVLEQAGNGTWWAGFLDPKDIVMNAETAPHAICLVALKAVGVLK